MKRHGTAGETATLPATLPKLRTVKEIRDAYTISRTAIYRGVLAGTFPRPVQLTPTRIAWRETDLLGWLAARQAGGRGAAA